LLGALARARFALADRRQPRDLGRGGKLLAAVEGGEERRAHQHGGGDAGEEGAGKPARRDLAAVGRAAAAVGDQRRLIAEGGYGELDVVHPSGGFPPEPALAAGGGP